MLSGNSSSELIFNESKHQYDDALSKSSFETEITYKLSTPLTTKK